MTHFTEYLKVHPHTALLVVLAAFMAMMMMASPAVAGGPLPKDVTMVLDNMVVPPGPVEVTFGLTPDGPTTTGMVLGREGEPIRVELSVPEHPGATGWMLQVHDAEGVPMLQLGGPFPPRVGAGYTHIDVGRDVTSADADRSLGEIRFREFGAIFFFESTREELEAGGRYQGNLWVDINGDGERQTEELSTLAVGTTGKAVRGVVDVRISEDTAAFEADLSENGAVFEAVAGQWDFSHGRPLAVSQFPVLPSRVGFQPRNDQTLFKLPNLLPAADLFKIAGVPGTPWVIVSGPDQPRFQKQASYLRIAVVRIPSGQPVPKATIEVMDEDAIVFQGQTDPSGTVEAALEPRKHRVRVTADGFPQTVETVLLVEGETQHLVVAMTPLNPPPSEKVGAFFKKYGLLLVFGTVGVAAAGGAWATTRARRG